MLTANDKRTKRESREANDIGGRAMVAVAKVCERPLTARWDAFPPATALLISTNTCFHHSYLGPPLSSGPTSTGNIFTSLGSMSGEFEDVLTNQPVVIDNVSTVPPLHSDANLRAELHNLLPRAQAQ